MKMTKSHLSISTFVPAKHVLAHPAVEQRLRELQRNIRSVWRAVRLMVFLLAFALVGLGYSTVFVPYWPQNMEQFLMFLPFKAHCVLGLAALGCAGYFSVLGLRYNRELTGLRLQCQPVVAGVAEPAEGRVIPLPAIAEQPELRPEAA